MSKNKAGKWNDKFVKPGFILGIISVATALIGVCGFVGIPGIVFSALGMKTKNQELKSKTKKGLIMSIVGTAVGLLVFTAAIICLLIFVIAQIGYPGGN